jgi:uncharacterized protein YecE (DUF72 family)
VTARGEILFGVAGWSYPDWKDIVYPRNCKDTLRAVAQKVPLIEINSTFYRPPEAKTCSSWVERSQDLGTTFTAKVPQDFTHTPVLDHSQLEPVLAGFAPLCESGRMLAFLAQFHFTFAFTPSSMERLRVLAESFGRRAPLVVEVRHRTWNSAPALDALRALGVCVAALDYPAMATGYGVDVPPSHPSGLAYYRLHGRNQAWFQKDAGRDQVYDWEYSPAEVKEIEQRIGRLTAADGVRLAVVANNHFHGKAMKLVEQLLAWYRGDCAGPGTA